MLNPRDDLEERDDIYIYIYFFFFFFFFRLRGHFLTGITNLNFWCLLKLIINSRKGWIEAIKNVRFPHLCPPAGIALTTRQVARGESKINLANRFLIKFAITDIFGDSI